MIIRQRDIVEIAFYTGNKPEPHPAVVISKDDIFEVEGFFYAILLSTKNIFPEFTLEITLAMINSPRNQRTGYTNRATLKSDAFEKLTIKVKGVIFG